MAVDRLAGVEAVGDRQVPAAVGAAAVRDPQQIAVPRAMDAFEADGSLKDAAQQKLCTAVVEALAVAAKSFIVP